MIWLTGPAGAGKSAIAQTCAEELEETLGATFFFSQPDRIDDPHRLFPTIAYQLATRNPSFAALVEDKLLHDRTLVSKSMKTQFRELIVAPLRILEANGVDIGPRRTVIIDGLDECRSDDAQCEIARIIMASIREESLPLSWAIFSRAEMHLTPIINLIMRS